MPVTEEDRARLARLVAADVAPTLSDEDLDALLTDAQRADANGVLPSEDGWVATYDFNAAAAAGWRQKAGMAVTFNFAAHGQQFDRSQIQTQCLAMATTYEKLARRSGSVRVASLVSPWSGDDELDDEGLFL